MMFSACLFRTKNWVCLCRCLEAEQIGQDVTRRDQNSNKNVKFVHNSSHLFKIRGSQIGLMQIMLCQPAQRTNGNATSQL